MTRVLRDLRSSMILELKICKVCDDWTTDYSPYSDYALCELCTKDYIYCDICQIARAKNDIESACEHEADDFLLCEYCDKPRHYKYFIGAGCNCDIEEYNNVPRFNDNSDLQYLCKECGEYEKAWEGDKMCTDCEDERITNDKTTNTTND